MGVPRQSRGFTLGNLGTLIGYNASFLEYQKQLAQMFPSVPVVFMAYDILEDGGADVRERPLDERRARRAADPRVPGAR